ncbi:MAG: hypothetical protein AAF570_24845, partial [Bacteroidota bacterium]
MKPQFTTFLFLFFAYFTLSAQLSPIQIGRSSNAFSITHVGQNQVVASDAMNLVAFVHQHDITVFGGGSANAGKLRYALSLDGGQTFNSGIGELNPQYNYTTRHPNISLYNPSGQSDTAGTRLIVAAPTVEVGGEYNGFLQGRSTLVTSGSPNVSEGYVGTMEIKTITSSLSQSFPDKWWMVGFGHNGTNLNDTIVLFTGQYMMAGDSVAWSEHS